MKLYSAMRYGNDEQGPDGDDTEFIVLSDSVESVAAIVDAALGQLPHKLVDPFCHAIVLIGDSYSSHDKSLILSGPTLVHNSRYDIGIPEDNIWRREDDAIDGGWVMLKDY